MKRTPDRPLGGPRQKRRYQPRQRPIGQQLCDACSEIDFSALFSDSYDFGDDTTGVLVRTVEHIKPSPSRGKCPLCDFLWEMRIGMDGKDEFCLRAFSALHYFFADRTRPKIPPQSKQLSQLSSQIVLAVVPLSFPTTFIKAGVGEYGAWSALGDSPFIIRAADGLTFTEGFFGRKLNEQKIDYNAIREWLSFCSEHHKGPCQSSSTNSLPGFGVIDCETRRIIRHGHPVKYVTLSYVWGSVGSEVEQIVDGVLPSRVPSVIEDAMSVTRKLGFRFLWVDRYCIDQNSPEEKHTQIRNMHSIYADSSITIIAAARQGPGSGLPGVSSTVRDRQPTVDVGNCILVSTLHKTISVTGSAWDTRAWTYQEGLLSRRRLVFTSSQVYFQCGGMHCVEGISLPLTTLHKKGRGGFLENFKASRFFPQRGVGKQALDYWKRVSEYRNRSLSYESDGLNAFLGIIGGFETLPNPVEHIWGLPLFASDIFEPPEGGRSARLCYSLAWCSTFTLSASGCTRRACFPSWSWVGWDVADMFVATEPIGTYHAHLPRPKIKDDYRCDVKIAIQTKSSSKVVDLDRLSGWSQEILTDASATMLIAARTLKVRLKIEDYQCLLTHDNLRSKRDSKVQLDKKPGDDASFSEKLHSGEEFLAILLCYTGWGATKLLILEYHEEDAAYERIGIANPTFKGRIDGSDSIFLGKRIIRLK